MDFHPDPGEPSQPFSQTYRADTELRSLIQALPTKADIVALIGTVEAAHRKELNAVKLEVKALTTRITPGESSLSTLEQWVLTLEAFQESRVEALVNQQLHLEDMEGRSRRNNLQLRGIPEATGAEDLADTTIAIFRSKKRVEEKDVLLWSSAYPETIYCHPLH